MKTELLAPAGDMARLKTAIIYGADAVYFGGKQFSLRSRASNFTLEDIREAVEFAHGYGRKVYVTVNTIVYDDELDATCRLLQALSEAGVDAILVQDMAVLQMMRSLPMAAHASTQTDNRSVEKVKWLHDIGFSRVVLARELSLDEIREIHSQEPDVELEVFVHGALCVSYSGLCYASQYCFARSANRGACAQFCRMKFSLQDAKGREVVRDRYLLSLKDMNRIDHLENLAEVGVSSFKIEGRLKNLSYVKNVTAAYSQRLNALIRRHPDLYCRSSQGVCSYTFTPDLNRTFNRGYTTYFLHGRMPDIASMDTPKAMGAFVGMVKEIRHDSFNVAGVASFANGDGLCFLDEARQLIGFRANKVVGNRIYPYRMPQGLKPGTRLYRNNDQEFDRLMSKPSAERRIPICMTLRDVADGFELSASIHDKKYTLHYPAALQQAQKPPHDNIIRQLTKLGDTIYVCEAVDIPAGFNYFIPNSLLSDMRRQLVEKLVSQREEPLQLDVAKPSACAPYAYPYLNNIANQMARDFYGAKELSAYELKGGDGPIMQCRHCIRYALGYCVKHGGQRPVWQEPLSLILGDGRRFTLEFDCKNCQMNVYAS